MSLNTPPSAVVLDSESVNTKLVGGRWLGALIALVILTEQTALIFTMIAPALLAISQQFQVTQIIWVISVQSLVGTISIPIFSKLADRFGKKKILVVAALLSALGGVICALAPTFAVLLIGRALTGTTFVFSAVAFALIRDVFPERRRALTMAIITNGVGVVVILGPFIAGYLLDDWGVSAIFYFSAVLCLLGGLGVAALVPETPLRTKEPFDWLGAVLLTGGLFALMFGLTHWNDWGFGDLRLPAVLLAAAIVLVGWWVWERRARHPFIDTRLITRREILTPILAYTFILASGTMSGSFGPMLMQTPAESAPDYGFGITATGVAWVMAPASIIIVISGFVVGFTAKKVGFRFFLVLGAIFALVAQLSMAFFWTSLVVISILMAINAMSSVSYGAAPGLLMQASPPNSRAVTAGMMSTSSGVISTIAGQVVGTILAANIASMDSGVVVYHHSAIQTAFLVGAGLALAGLVLAVLIPKKITQLPATEEVDLESADAAAPTTHV